MNPADQEVKLFVQVIASKDAIDMTLNLSYAGRDGDLTDDSVEQNSSKYAQGLTS